MNSYVTTSTTGRLSSGYISTDAAAPVAAGYVSLPASAPAPAEGSYVRSELGSASRYVLAS